MLRRLIVTRVSVRSVNDSDDLRGRIEAQIAANRQRRRHTHAQRLQTPPEDALPLSSAALRHASPSDETQIIEAIPPDEKGEIPASRRRRPPRQFAFPIRMLALLAVTALLAFGLRAFVVEPFWIPSESMEPTLHGCSGCDNDRLLVDRLSYRLHAVHRGDVVVFHRPPQIPTAEKVLIKRVIGLPGETVSGHDGKVWIGSRPLEEPYVNPKCGGATTYDFGPKTIPSGEYFVMGDNRCDSTDSRYFGPIPRSSIIGRAFLIIWPIGRIRWL